jgi:hypothetical protein
MISPGNSRSSQGFFLCFSFCSGSVLCKLSEISSLLWPWVRFIRCSLGIKLTAFCSSSAWRALAFSLPILLYLFPRMVLDPSCSFCQKGTRVSLVCHTQWYFGLTFCSQTMLPFMGVVDNSTTGPFFINWFLSLGSEGDLLSPSREIWGYLI